MNTQDSYFSYLLDEFKSIFQQTTYQNRGNHLDYIFLKREQHEQMRFLLSIFVT